MWDYVFGKNCFNVDTASKSVVFTEPYFNFASIQDGLNEILFEEYRYGQEMPLKMRTSIVIWTWII